MPYISPGTVTPENLPQLGEFVKAMGSVGIVLNDEDTENKLRNTAGLPNRSLEPGDGGVDLQGNPKIKVEEE